MSSSGIRTDGLRTGDGDNSSVILLEASNQVEGGTGKGRLWVKNTVPNTLIFTNDSGTDTTLGGYGVKDEGVTLGTFDSLNFDNTKFTIANIDNIATITPSSGTINISSQSIPVGTFGSYNFIGPNVTVTDGGGGVATITLEALVTIQNEGVALGDFRGLNVVGEGITATTDGIGEIGTITLTQNTPTIEQVLLSDNNANNREINSFDTFLFSGGVNLTNGNTSVIGSTPTTSIAIGESPSCTGSESVALGNNSTVTANKAVAVGTNASVTGLGGIALGYNSSCTADYGIAIGYNSSCTGNYGIAIGYETVASNTYVIAVGASTNGSGLRSITLGSNSINSGADSICLGNNCTVSHDYCVIACSNTDSRSDYETCFSGIRTINKTVTTTDTTLTNIITFPMNTNEAFSVDCFVTERNTVSSSSILYTFRDYHFRRKGAAVATVTAGTSTTNNPDAVSAGTVTLGVSGDDLVVNVTADDNDNRIWNVVISINVSDAV